AILPAFLIRRPLLGVVLTSMPFLDSGGPCGKCEDLYMLLVAELVRKAGEFGAKRVELRCSTPLDLDTPANQDKVTMELSLPDDPDVLWQGLNAKVRNQVRKAQKSGLTFEHAGAEGLQDFYRIWAINMRDLGSPPHSLKFFEEIFKAFGENAHLHLVYDKTQPIGGLMGLTYGDTFAVPWASSLRESFKLCPNMLLYWETIKRASDLGYKTFDFGRSGRNQGTYHFKKQWGAEEKQLYWYTIPVKSKSVKQISGNDSTGKLLTSIWKKLPLNFTIWLGPKIRKYLTQ
ncbi:MAG: GNAT family N-acetyltransferase, partial [bacterium]